MSEPTKGEGYGPFDSMLPLPAERTDEQIAEQLAAFMGWTRTFDGWLTDKGWRGFNEWVPTQNLEQAFAVQAEIVRRGNLSEFVAALYEAVEIEHLSNDVHRMWKIANATARQRCLAAIAVIGGGK